MIAVVNHGFKPVVVDSETILRVSDGEIQREIVIEIVVFDVKVELCQLCFVDLEFHGIGSEHDPNNQRREADEKGQCYKETDHIHGTTYPTWKVVFVRHVFLRRPRPCLKRKDL